MNTWKVLSLTDLVATAIIVAILGTWVSHFLEAREARTRSMVLNGLAGSLRSGAALAHASWLAQGGSTSLVMMPTNQPVEIDPLSGYPRATREGILSVLPQLEGFASFYRGDDYVFSFSGVRADRCHLRYTTGTTRGAPPVVSIRTNKNGGDCS